MHCRALKKRGAWWLAQSVPWIVVIIERKYEINNIFICKTPESIIYRTIVFWTRELWCHKHPLPRHWTQNHVLLPKSLSHRLPNLTPHNLVSPYVMYFPVFFRFTDNPRAPTITSSFKHMPFVRYLDSCGAQLLCRPNWYNFHSCPFPVVVGMFLITPA